MIGGGYRRPVPSPQPTHALRQLTRTAALALARVVPRGSKVALINFPNHGNPGDPALWLGSRALLRSLGLRIGYSAAWWNFDERALRSALPKGPVLLNGGGNFGDLYAGQQGTRERVLATMTDRLVVQLPQSIYFRDPANADRVARLITAHGHVELMVRERASLHRAAALGLSASLSPDHALGLGPLRSRVKAGNDVLWLVRTAGDPEYGGHADPPDDARITRVEWMTGIADAENSWHGRAALALAVNRRLRESWARGGRGSRGLWPDAAATFPTLARAWAWRGVDILSSARVVVTDRLHGHLLSVLLGKPHVVLDNSYGKVSATLDTWTGSLPGVHRAADAEQAWEMAIRLLHGTDG